MAFARVLYRMAYGPLEPLLCMISTVLKHRLRSEGTMVGSLVDFSMKATSTRIQEGERNSRPRPVGLDSLSCTRSDHTSDRAHGQVLVTWDLN